jgi:hypothetical protein
MKHTMMPVGRKIQFFRKKELECALRERILLFLPREDEIRLSNVAPPTIQPTSGERK